uniref:Uncharacterized protein n=1 Tax=Vespula pensylvanica TaxID=30213 RepID=A0A834MWD1_VESPE|nr:hypothetical protein H0235_018457 [Vespula pensylvanica]
MSDLRLFFKLHNSLRIIFTATGWTLDLFALDVRTEGRSDHQINENFLTLFMLRILFLQLIVECCNCPWMIEKRFKNNQHNIYRDYTRKFAQEYEWIIGIIEFYDNAIKRAESGGTAIPAQPPAEAEQAPAFRQVSKI